MTALYRNNFIRGSRSMAGDQVITCITRSGKIIMTEKPVFDDQRTVTDPRKSQRETLNEATTYAQYAESEDVYINTAREMGTTAYNPAIVAWLGAPKVLEVNVDAWTGEIGQTIHVKARDNVMIARVGVARRQGEHPGSGGSRPGRRWECLVELHYPINGTVDAISDRRGGCPGSAG